MADDEGSAVAAPKTARSERAADRRAALRAGLGRVAEFWVYGTAPAAILLLLLAPVVMDGRPRVEVLTYLALPAYMVHQVEEHDADRFRRFVNALLGPNHAGLSFAQVAVINLGFVWLPLAVALALTVFVAPGWAVLAAWLMLVNAGVHILQGVLLGGYNPGLATAGVLFLPLGTAILITAEPTSTQHIVALGATVAVHIAIVIAARAPVGHSGEEPA